MKSWFAPESEISELYFSSRCHGGVEDKDLVKLVTNKPNNDDDYDDDDNDEMDTMSYSPYFCPAAYQTAWLILNRLLGS